MMSMFRWRGNWSELDTGHWTPSFRQALDYNPDDAANFDNGILHGVISEIQS